MTQPRNCIMRLSRYRCCLITFKNLGYIKIFSDNLGDASGVTASQVRKDFSVFGISGNKKGGYQITDLLEKIDRILGKDRIQKVILVGAGNLGSALLKYRGFENEDIDIVAGFDADPAKCGKKGDTQILPVDNIFEFVRKNTIKVALLAVPAAVAQQISELIVSAGIKGILNFAPVTLQVPEKIIVTNVNLAIELENVIYYVNALEKKQA